MKENKENLYSVMAANFAVPAVPIIREVNGKDYVFFGEDNLYPERLIELYNSSAMHRTCATAVSDGVFGEGISTIGDEYINLKGETIDDIFEKITLDYILYGGYALNLIWNREGTQIAEIYHLAFANVRSGKMDENDEVNEYYYSSNWANLRKYPFIPYRAYDAMDNKGDNASQIYYYYDYTPGQEIYPLPLYQAAVTDITLDAKISRYHLNNIQNGLSPSLFISFKNGTPTPEQRYEVYKSIQETYAGEEAAGRFFLSFSDPDNAPEVTPISSTNDTYYLQINDHVISRILSAWRITSPKLLGLYDASGFSSNAEEIKVAYAHFEGTVVEPIRKKLTTSFGYILKLSGYNIKIKVVPNRLIEDAAAGMPDDLANNNPIV